MDSRYNRHNRWKYSLKVHIVLVTKYRKQLLKDSIADDVKQKILDIANTRGYEIIAIDTDKAHIHFLLSYDTTDGTLTVVDPHISKNVDYNVIFLSNFPDFNVVWCCIIWYNCHRSWFLWNFTMTDVPKTLHISFSRE